MIKYLVYLFICIVVCSASTCVNTHSKNLKKVNQYDLTMPEPSGLALDPSGNFLWIVSDRKGQIYKTDLVGHVVDKIDIKASDFEGVAIDKGGTKLYALDETKNRIDVYDLKGKKTQEIKLSEKVSNKSGPEGIDIDWANGNIIVVNEKNPRTMYILDQEGNEKQKQEITPLSDLSAVCIDPETKEIWLLSDQDQKLIRAKSDYSVTDEYLIDIDQMEGLAIDYLKKRIYIVSDAEEELHIFDY